MTKAKAREHRSEARSGASQRGEASEYDEGEGA
jgi:hypothetical protein